MSDAPRILLVGHCVPDAYAMRGALQRAAPDAEFVFVNDDSSLGAHPDAAAMLVNRVLDGRFAARTGLELIRSLPPERRRGALLISNMADAQAEAEAAGAAPGFGKSELYSDRARTAILTLLGRSARS